jgi:DNA helicase-2/ATP-dependent DNA helicase PcrA
MHLIADLHIHSHYSRATSKQLTFPNLALWARRKGVHIVGTGDLSHPGWLAEMQENLEPAEPGLYRLKPEIERALDVQTPAACQGKPVRFLLSGEISSIYKRGGKVRKVHNVIFAPHLEMVARIQAELEKIGNIRSDGRPILGLDSRDLLEIILELSPRNHLIPAHIWTPWFAMMGSKSGFDSVEACFADLTPHIFALETGLSSDPPMNWRISNLDRYALVSSSDAHSPAKLAREATRFDIEPSYDALFQALRTHDLNHYRGTLEFFPEEGKYHYDGHRKCGIVWEPRTTLAHNNLCPVCGKPVTVGVMHRVETLADREPGIPKPNAAPFHSLIPLPEIISEVQGVGPNSKRVQREYHRILAALGPELEILFDLPLDAIASVAGPKLAQGIGKMRQGEIVTQPGYDGEFGVIKLFAAPSLQENQQSLFENKVTAPAPHPAPPPMTPVKKTSTPPAGPLHPTPAANAITLNQAQLQAIHTTDVPLIIVAGSGAGKTRTLTQRIAHLITQKNAAPESILAITFTNKAAQEMQERLAALVGKTTAERITISTFHAFGAAILRQHWRNDFSILDETQREKLVKTLFLGPSSQARRQFLQQLSTAKQHLLGPDDPQLTHLCPGDPDFAIRYRAYHDALQRDNLLDFDDLIYQTVRLLQTNAHILADLHARYRWISVDEYQDLNRGQYHLLRLLTQDGANICVIGDPDQAIYSFRGADPSYFRRFLQDYPQARKIILQQNYRSAASILQAAQQVIAKNPDREAIALMAQFSNNLKLSIHQAPTHKAEAEYVVHHIESDIGGTSNFSLNTGRVADATRESGLGFGDFAVLYRLKAQSAPLIEAFHRSGIPYQTVGQTPFSVRPQIRLLLAALNILHNPQSQIHRAQLPATLPSSWPERAIRQPVSQLIIQLATLLLPQDDEKADVQRLAHMAQPFGHELAHFLTHMALQSETDSYDPRADRVTLMTLHAAKGLEFDTVFIVGCEEGLLPHIGPNQQVNLEEERRLFYVGMTRAKRKLILTHARKRFLFGKELHNSRSQFVDDIETALLEIEAMQAMKKKRKAAGPEQLSLF